MQQVTSHVHLHMLLHHLLGCLWRQHAYKPIKELLLLPLLLPLPALLLLLLLLLLLRQATPRSLRTRCACSSTTSSTETAGGPSHRMIAH
jgi:hypothetical protein